VSRGGATLPIDSAAHGVARWWRSGEAPILARAAFASLLATAVDGAAYHLALSTTRAPVGHYAVAAALGALLGAIANFSLNRWWTFRGQVAPLAAQAIRYAVGSALTLLVLQGVLWLLVERAFVTTERAWLPAKLVTWAAFSYPLQRLLVFAGARR
jgi:putative flippase GtrA